MHYFKPFLKIGSICFILLFLTQCSNESIELSTFPQDIDGDNIVDENDNCLDISNPEQEDNDNDGIGNLCDSDDDNDGVLDDNDNCPFIANPNQADADNDGIGDVCDEQNGLEPLALCENGFAGIYPCNDYDLVSHIPISELGGSGAEGNDSWGWTDQTTGKEYALIGTSTGATFVDISIPTQPVLLGRLPTATGNSSWRDIKVYNDHAFIVSEAANHGMQVFDLARLRNVTEPPETFLADALYTGFGDAHNITINESSGFAYVVGSDTFDGGPHFVNIQNPTSPQAAGGFADESYSHDSQVVNYNGPDTDYVGSEILISSNGDVVVIVDVTDKTNPTTISTISYSNIGYAHQGWFTEDMAYFLIGDEVDEIDFGGNTRTIIFDLSDLNNPLFHMSYVGSTAAIDHNGYVVGNLFYQSNYTAGVRMIDITNIDSNSMSEVGFFDSYPPDNSTSFHGAWNIYPFFASGNILISDIEGGMFIIHKSEF